MERYPLSRKKDKVNKKYLIITADDFGANSNINKSIELAFNDGVLDCASLMATSPNESFEEAVDIAKKNPKLDVGIHLTLVSDDNIYQKALSYYECDKGLTREGYFLDSRTFILQNSLFKTNIGLIEKEIRLQIERVLEHGINPSFINSHYYISELPFIKSLELKLAIEYGIKTIRIPRQGLIITNNAGTPIISGMLKNYLSQLILNGLISINMVRNRSLLKQLVTNDYFFGVMNTFRMNKKILIDIIKNIKYGVTEILFHPSLVNGQYCHEKIDLEMLLDPEIKKLILSEDVKQINFNNLHLYTNANC